MISGDYVGDLCEGVREGNGKLTWVNGGKKLINQFCRINNLCLQITTKANSKTD